MPETEEEVREKTPLERARVIRDREIGYLQHSILGHHNHFDALRLAIYLFGDDEEASFSLQAYEATVSITTKDVNASLRCIHHIMRTAGWKTVAPFNKEYLTWQWREAGSEMPSHVIGFQILLADDSTCRKVQVGTKEVPVYEIQCEDSGRSFDIQEPSDDQPNTEDECHD